MPTDSSAAGQGRGHLEAGATVVPETDAGAPHHRHVPDWLILLVVCVGQFMVVLDVSIVNVALPSMQRSLGFSQANLQWVVTAYALTFGGLLLLGGRLADLYGRRRIFLVGLGLFTAASLLGGFSQNQATLIVARAVQGIGAAVLSPATLTILTVSFTEARARAKAFGVWSATAAGGGAAGALLGGILTQYLSWRWILFVNVPIGVVAFVAARLVITESREVGASRRMDVAGAVTVTAGMGALVYAIVHTDAVPWGSAQTLGMLGLAAVLLAVFVAIEARVADHPLVPLRLFRSRALTGANLSMFSFGVAMFAMWFFLSLYLQKVLGFDPLVTGFAFLPQTAAIAISATAAGRIAPRVGARNLIVAGGVVAAGGLFWLSMMSPTDTYWTGVFGGATLATFGMGLAFTPIAIAATAGVRPSEAGLASGVVNMSRQVGASVGLAVLVTVAVERTTALLAGGGHGAAAIRAATTSGYDRGFVIGAIVVLAGALIALVIPAHPHPVEREPEPAAERPVVRAGVGEADPTRPDAPPRPADRQAAPPAPEPA